MVTLDTSDGLVAFRLASTSRAWRLGGAALLVLPASVCAASTHHAVHWWGWLPALVGLVAAIVVSCHRPEVTGVLAVDDWLVVATRSSSSTIPAEAVERLVAMPQLGNTVLDLGTEYQRLPVADLWRGTGYPTGQVIAPWIIRHGGGRGRARDLDVVKRSWIVNLGRGLRRPAVWKRLAWVLPLFGLCNLWLSALFGHDRPRLGGGWGIALGSLLVGVENAGKEPTVITDWTALDVK